MCISHDILNARTMARIVMDVAWNEEAPRRRQMMPKQLDRSVMLRIGSVKDRTLRACYLCEEILGQPGVFESESLYHMLMDCPHASMRDLRTRLRDDVTNLCQMDVDHQSPGTTRVYVELLWCIRAVGGHDAVQHCSKLPT